MIDAEPTAMEIGESHDWTCPECGAKGIYIYCEDCGWMYGMEWVKP